MQVSCSAAAAAKAFWFCCLLASSIIGSQVVTAETPAPTAGTASSSGSGSYNASILLGGLLATTQVASYPGRNDMNGVATGYRPRPP